MENKKLWFLFIFVFVFISLLFVYRLINKEEKNNEAVTIEITNKSEIEIYSIQLQFIQNDIWKPGPASMYANRKPIKYAHSLSFELEEGDIAFGTPIYFHVMVTLGKNFNQQVPIFFSEPMNFVKGETFRFEIIGGSKRSLNLVQK